MFGRDKTHLIDAADALPGRTQTMPIPERHHVSGAPLGPDFPDGIETAVFGMGCFWGAERKFWELDGVFSTAVGYAGGHTPNPTYEETCSGRTGHTEVVLVAYDPAKVTYETLLTTFWENHDPTQGMRQGNDRGTQYRSAIYATADQLPLGRGQPRSATRRCSRRPATATSPPRSVRWRTPRSSTPRTTTSSTCRRTRWATAASAAPA